MQTNIILREYQREDASFLEDIIRKTWEYDRFCSAKTARRQARIYLCSCLCEQTFTRVAVQDGIPVGIIMGRDKKLRPAHNLWVKLRMAWTELAMLCSREGRSVLKVFGQIDHVDKELLENRGKEYNGELVFFAIRKDCRGAGIGKMLFRKAQQYMKEQKIRDFYLYTDTSCNYPFYEHQGMVRCGQKVYSVPIGIDNEMRFYLYEYTLEGRKGEAVKSGTVTV